jgi:uncharacterized membrane protein YphA (DoxX/SURF4 family)
MDKLFICFYVFLLLFIFLAGGWNKIANFKDTANYLESKINTIQLNPTFIAAIITTILYFCVIIFHMQPKNMYLFILISVVIAGIPFLAYFKKYLNQNQAALVSFIYDTAIAGVIGLLTFGSLLILYSLYASKYQEYAYIATIGLAVFTAMTILIFHFPTNKSEMISFTKNLSIFGGLMLLSQRFSN